MSQITANVWTTFELFEWSLPVLILVFGSDSKFNLLDIFHYMPFVFRWFINWNRSCRNDRLRNSLYKIQNNFLHDSIFKIQTATVIFSKTRQWHLTHVHGQFIWKCHVIQISISEWPRQGQCLLISYPSIFSLRSKFDNDVMIKLGPAARLWNGPSLRGHKWRNGARFQNKNQNGLRTNVPNKLADLDGVLNRLCAKWDFVNTNQHSLTTVWIILFQLNF